MPESPPNEGRSITLRGTLPLDLTPAQAWEAFSEVEEWPRWDWLGSAHSRWVSGPPWTVGARMRLGHRPGVFDCVVVLAEPPARVVWEGRGAGIHGRHSFGFLPHPRGCLMYTEETFRGRGARLMRFPVRPFWHHQLHAFRRYTRARSRRSATRAGGFWRRRRRGAIGA